MVDPMPDEERISGMLKLKVGFVVLIGASALLIGIQGGADLLELLVVTLAGTLFGGLVIWYVFPKRGSVDDRRQSYRKQR